MKVNNYRKGSTKGLVWKNPAMKGRSRAFKAVWQNYNASAITRGLAFSLTPDEFAVLIAQNCHYCGEPPATRRWKHLKEPITYNGLDRIDNEVGYEVGNLVPCCKDCNLMRGRRTYKAFIARVLKIAGAYKPL